MATDSFQAWMIHKRWSGDTSAQVTFFTCEYGLISCLYKGGRTPKKQALLQPFMPLWLAVNQRRDWFYVQSLELSSLPLLLTDNALFSALYINELIYCTCRANDPHPELFEAYKTALDKLSTAMSRQEIEVILRRFEWRLLKLSGYQIPLTHDISNTPIQAETHYRFIPGEGFEAIAQGIEGKYILAFAEGNIEEIHTLRAIKRFMRQAIDHLLDGRILKTRALFVQRLAQAGLRMDRE